MNQWRFEYIILDPKIDNRQVRVILEYVWNSRSSLFLLTWDILQHELLRQIQIWIASSLVIQYQYWMFPEMGVPPNHGFSLTNQPFLGYPNLWKPPNAILWYILGNIPLRRPYIGLIYQHTFLILASNSNTTLTTRWKSRWFVEKLVAPSTKFNKVRVGNTRSQTSLSWTPQKAVG